MNFTKINLLNLIFALSLGLGLGGCASFKGPGTLQGTEFQGAEFKGNAPFATTSENVSPPQKKAKIESDLEHPPSETLDDQSEQNVFEHIPPPTDRATTESSIEMHFDWPVNEAKLSRGFLIRKRKPHWGLDLANKKGTSILAAESGYVVYIGRQFHGYGRLIVIEHNDQWATLYAHLNKFSVKEGDFVKRGDAIGEMGRTGHATGSHLHFELRDNRRPVDPIQHLPALQ